MKKIDVWEEHIYRIKVPLPFPLRWINSYAIKDEKGWTVIDPGLHTEDSVEVWHDFFRETGTKASDVHQIVLTHHHPDHYGLSGWMQQQSKARILLSSSGKQQAEDLWGPQRSMTPKLVELFKRHGMGDEELSQLQVHMEGFIPNVSPLPEITTLSEGETVLLGKENYVTLDTPGHALGHLSLYHEDSKIMFCGDHVIPQITPNVGFMPGADPDPLCSYLESLERMKAVEVRLALPGHRNPFYTYRERVEEIIAHHDKRLKEMSDLLKIEPLTGFEMCRKMFGVRLSIHQLRFALSETIAHLIFLERRGLIKQTEQDGLTIYSSS